jgi:hypothetical protein
MAESCASELVDIKGLAETYFLQDSHEAPVQPNRQKLAGKLLTGNDKILKFIRTTKTESGFTVDPD